MRMTTFEPIVANPDIDVHPSPPGPWSRVAVICRWKDAHAFRKRWPHAAVVGPLRTVRGIDELIRNLLHNPQIRVVVLDGPDLTPEEETTKALLAAWNPTASAAWEKHFSSDLHPYMRDLVWGCLLVQNTPKVYDDRTPFEELQTMAHDPDTTFSFRGHITLVPDEDRPGGRITLPPPPPKATSPAPHGDPQSLAADTLAELWPMVLQRAMRFGRLMATQYGDTRELLCLMAHVRDVQASLAEIQREAKHPVLGLAWDQIEAYRDQVAGLVPPTDRPYSYGSRMRGYAGGWRTVSSYTDGETGVTVECKKCGSYGPDGNECFHCGYSTPPDQFAAAEELLGTSPGTRAAYLTPWRPAEDAGKESGRPCMVGAWLRVEPTTTETEERDLAVDLVDQRNGYTIEFGDRAAISVEYEEEAARIRSSRSKLHLVVAFRSHDLFGAYGTNLSGLLLWQSETAGKLGMQVGTLTVTSYSAHVYARDWAAAEAIVEAHLPKGPYWDQRSTWRVECVEVPQTYPEAWPKVGEEVFHEHRGQFETYSGWWSIEKYELREGETEPYAVRLIPELKDGTMPDWLSTSDLLSIRPRRKRLLRATALTPDGKEVIEVFEAETEEGLRGKIERSGLVTSIGAALWLGDEIRRKT